VKPSTQVAMPLDEITVRGIGGAVLAVRDGRGREYVRRPVHGGDALAFTVAGALGGHVVFAEDAAGRVVDTAAFRVRCETHVEDAAGRFGPMLRDLFRTMVNSCGGDGASTVTVDGKLYRYFICWLRDHTHTLKGMKWFDGDLKTALELYADTQRADGMVYDRIRLKADVQGWRDYTFREGDFVKTLNPGTPNAATMQRIPVENDVEYLFVECLYQTWKATGDTPWMARHLDACVRAVAYATSDRYRWSETFGLLKRGYTIDTWDFLHADDCALTRGDNVVDVEKTTFGVMHGDNTGLAASCRYLAEMLRAAGRADDAPPYEALADALLERLEKLAWTGEHYRHHVSEDPSFVRDVGGTDEAAQVSLSNAYALNRGIGPDKCRAILETYRRIRREMPPASPGEFYNIYPPFERGFDNHDEKWQYMNGGVSTIVAGELARGAFENGFEEYGADILARIGALADRHGGRLHVCFHGNPQTEPPPRTFTPVDLEGVANVTAAYRPDGGWGDPGNDLSRLPTGEVEFVHVPFPIGPDACGLGLAHDRPGFARERRVPVGARHASMYLLHTVSQPGRPVCELDVVYADGERRRVYLHCGEQLDSWFMPGSAELRAPCHAPKLPTGWPAYQLAWRGGNDTFDNVGVFIWGWDNPRPDVEIAELVFRAAENGSVYFAAGITFSDRPVWFPQSDVSFGIPDAWGSAAVVYALIEGLAGLQDTGVAFDRARLAPRWPAAGEDRVRAAAVYPASGGYAAYDYGIEAGRLTLLCASTADRVDCEILLPPGRAAAKVLLDGEPCPHTTKTVGDSAYVCLAAEGPSAHEIVVELADPSRS